MKNKTPELDVDFIGGQETLSREEEIQISNYIQSQKILREKKEIRSTSIRRKKTLV